MISFSLRYAERSPRNSVRRPEIRYFGETPSRLMARLKAGAMVLASLSFVSSPHTFPTKQVHDRQDVPVVAIASYVLVRRHVDQIDNAPDLVIR